MSTGASRYLGLQPTTNESIGVTSLRGFVNRSFETAYVRIRDSYEGSKRSNMYFAFGVHVVPKDERTVDYTLVEVKYRMGDSPKWIHVDREAWLAFLGFVMDYDFHPSVDETARRNAVTTMRDCLDTLPDGETPCFKLDRWMWAARPSNLAFGIGECLVVDFVGEWAGELAVFLKYRRSITTVEDFQNVYLALQDVDSVSYSVKFDKHGVEKDSIIRQMDEERKSLQEAEEMLSSLYESAADALNELSSRWGIEIDLNDLKKG